MCKKCIHYTPCHNLIRRIDKRLTKANLFVTLGLRLVFMNRNFVIFAVEYIGVELIKDTIIIRHCIQLRKTVHFRHYE